MVWEFPKEWNLVICYYTSTIFVQKGYYSSTFRRFIQTEILKFGFKYSRYFILSNAVGDINIMGNIKKNYHDPLNIIFMSNLQASKGIFDFLGLADLCYNEQYLQSSI
jgi:hypothetical protein